MELRRISLWAHVPLLHAATSLVTIIWHRVVYPMLEFVSHEADPQDIISFYMRVGCRFVLLCRHPRSITSACVLIRPSQHVGSIKGEWQCSQHVMFLANHFLATDPEVRVRFPALSHFLRSSGSGICTTQPREYNWGATWKRKYRSRSRNPRIRPWGPLCWPRDTLYPQKLSLSSPTSGCRWIGIFRSRTQATEFCYFILKA
jgi:hypothetical protein